MVQFDRTVRTVLDGKVFPLWQFCRTKCNRSHTQNVSFVVSIECNQDSFGPMDTIQVVDRNDQIVMSFAQIKYVTS